MASAVRRIGVFTSGGDAPLCTWVLSALVSAGGITA